MSLLELFCAVDDFWNTFAPGWHQTLLVTGKIKRQRSSQLTASEIMTILIHFHQSHYRDFKAFYTEHVLTHLRAEFPGVTSYSRFVELIPSVLVPLSAYLEACRGQCNGLSFVDSTKLVVCHNRRIKSHRVFAGLAERGKDSVDWFYGFKLHLIVNDCGEILACRLTPGNSDDRRAVLPMAQRLFGKLIGDKGYLSKDLVMALLQHGVELLTPLRKNMKQRLVRLNDKLLLRKRVLIETINDQLKNISQIEHSRHRSPANFLVNVLAGIIAYCHQPKKPSLQVTPEVLALSGR
jgi:transposase